MEQNSILCSCNLEEKGPSLRNMKKKAGSQKSLYNSKCPARRLQMRTQFEIRKDFLDFFQSRDHTIMPSAPVVPIDDPTLLFTNAGMNQFKTIFQGTSTPVHVRVADTQKCLRVSGKHNDLDEVGRDTSHHTFFEMLGNWSFGDYFKAEAIEWAWLFLTETCGLPKESLWATYFGGDAREGLEIDRETRELWPDKAGIPVSRVLPFGKKYNFWEMGDTGPCGPCSEIHIDLGESFCSMKGAPGHTCSVNGECGRFIELWNLVFIQFDRKKDGTLTRLSKNHVDTGMGFERLLAVVRRTYSNYDTDLFYPLFQALKKLTGADYGRGSQDSDTALRVISDHVKALSFAIADGAVPEKKGRGSVLRSLLRRAARFGRQVLDMKEPFIYKLPEIVAEIYGPVFPEVGQRLDHIELIVREEELAFAETIDRGLSRFSSLAQSMKDGSKTELDGFEAYRLYHQDGFPRDLIDQMASEHGLTVDEKGWTKAECEHRERSKGETDLFSSAEIVDISKELQGLPATEFVGYWERGEALYRGTECRAQVLNIIGKERHGLILVLDRTPFYAESGGQVGDTGIIEGAEQAEGCGQFTFEVNDTRKRGDYILHYGKIVSGDIPTLPFAVNACVDRRRRSSVAANHTVTHLLHHALHRVLGPHALQQGSLVHPDYLRFDVTHPQAITSEELLTIETLVNEKIFDNAPLSIKVTSLEEAKREGVIALFGEKYGETVRVIDIGGYSKELCGGTHCERTGDIGSFYITAETSSEAGVRRIEAITQRSTIEQFQSDRCLLKKLSAVLHTNQRELPEKVESLVREIKELKKMRAQEGMKDVKSLREQLLAVASEAGDVKIVTSFREDLSPEQLGALADELRSGAEPVCGLLIAGEKDRLFVTGFASKDLVNRHKVSAGAVVKEVSSMLGGGGGGRPDFAKGGGKNIDKVSDALKKAEEMLRKALERTGETICK